MAFDRTNPAHLTQLSSELTLDPISMGYAGATSNPQILDLLNDPANNVGGETVGAEFTVDLMLQVIEPNDLTVGGQFTEGKLEWIKMLASGFADVSQFRTKFRDQFQPADQTVTNLDAEVMVISRAEVLWGVGTVISKQDLLAAQEV